VDGPVQDSAAEAKAWVEKNTILVDAAYQLFLVDGTWPDVLSLQRRFDRTDSDVEVQRAVDAKPRVTWEARPLHADRLALQLRHLMWLPEAKRLVDVCLQAVQRAVESYLSADDPPVVTSEDRLTTFPSDRHGGLALRAYEVLRLEHPSPFGGSSRTDTRWEIQVDPRFARRFRDVRTVAEFVTRQDEIRAEMSRENLGMTPVLDVDPEIHRYEFSAMVLPADPVLFLSWAKGKSKKVARALKPVLESRLSGVEVFFSPASIEPGDDPSRRLFDYGLLGSSALVVVLTQASAVSPFVIWETAAAWGRGELVIPVFVDIEPSSVPGPITIKVQGVHLGDRDDMDRGIERLASYFGVADTLVLTDEEYGTLEQAAGEGA
jgi:hypothetical protein